MQFKVITSILLPFLQFPFSKMQLKVLDSILFLFLQFPFSKMQLKVIASILLLPSGKFKIYLNLLNVYLPHLFPVK